MADPTKHKYEQYAMEWFRKYYEKGMTIVEIGKEYGVPFQMVDKYLGLKKFNDKYSEESARKERKAEMRKRAAAMRAIDASPLMMDQIIAIASQSVADTDIKFQYAIHNAAADILNRAGIQAKQEESKEVHVVLETGIELGEPE